MRRQQPWILAAELLWVLWLAHCLFRSSRSLALRDCDRDCHRHHLAVRCSCLCHPDRPVDFALDRAAQIVPLLGHLVCLRPESLRNRHRPRAVYRGSSCQRRPGIAPTYRRDCSHLYSALVRIHLVERSVFRAFLVLFPVVLTSWDSTLPACLRT